MISGQLVCFMLLSVRSSPAINGTVSKTVLHRFVQCDANALRQCLHTFPKEDALADLADHLGSAAVLGLATAVVVVWMLQVFGVR